jgi:hypothetical protein
MPLMGFKPMILLYEQTKTFNALDSAATVIDFQHLRRHNYPRLLYHGIAHANNDQLNCRIFHLDEISGLKEINLINFSTQCVNTILMRPQTCLANNKNKLC